MQYSDPFETMTDLRRRLYRVLEGRVPQAAPRPASFSPPLDIEATPTGVVITVELPGLDRDSVTVELQGNVLTISGERPADLDEQLETVYRRERPFGRFSRSLALPGGSEHKIEARMADGVLTITVTVAEVTGQ